MFKGSMVALITPYKNNVLDEKALKELVEWHISEGTQGILVCGSTGEGMLLTQDEQKRILEVCLSVAKGRLPVIANISALTLEGVFSLAQQVQEVGAQGMIIVPPPYSRPSQEGIFQFIKRVHDATTLPLVVYNNPGRCAVGIAQETIVQLSHLPRVVGYKDSGGEVGSIPLRAPLFPPDFVQLCGEDELNAAFLAQGGHGWISVTANVAPGLCAQMYQAWEQGNLAEFGRLRDLLAPLHKALFVETSPAPVKYGVASQGFCTDEVRLPLIKATEKARQAVDQALRHAGISQKFSPGLLSHGL